MQWHAIFQNTRGTTSRMLTSPRRSISSFGRMGKRVFAPGCTMASDRFSIVDNILSIKDCTSVWLERIRRKEVTDTEPNQHPLVYLCGELDAATTFFLISRHAISGNGDCYRRNRGQHAGLCLLIGLVLSSLIFAFVHVHREQ